MAEPPADTALNEIGVLKRREIEARILAPILEALAREFDPERVREIAREIARDVIVRIAREQGALLAEAAGGNSLAHFSDSLACWKKDDALSLEILEQSEDRLSFNVTRCRYAELYRALGIPELGALLSCNRDYSLIEGFNSEVSLTRTQTIMQGASHCDFRFQLRKPKGDGPPD